MNLADRHRIAANLKAARIAKGLNPTQFGALFGIARRTVYGWESGEVTFSPQRLQDIADGLGVPVETLTSGPRRGAR